MLKIRKLSRKVAAIPNSRWATYAAAGAATALSGISAAEAEIHYSGIVNHDFRPPGSAASFTVGSGDKLQFRVGVPHGGGESGGFGHLQILDGQNNSVGGFAASHPSNAGVYLLDLAARVNISSQNITNSCRRTSSSSNLVCYGATFGGPPEGFEQRGIGAIGFAFRDGAGLHYGWARIRTSGPQNYRFVLVDYAWGDAGESVLTGQKGSHQTGSAVPATGSLGLLAIGGAGLVAWRISRSQSK